jgi:hypothetical protein
LSATANEEGTLARLRALRSDLIDPAIAVHRGRVVKRTGDGLISEFRSVVDAVRCAIELQRGMIERNAGVPEDHRIEFRIGVHLGDLDSSRPERANTGHSPADWNRPIDCWICAPRADEPDFFCALRGNYFASLTAVCHATSEGDVATWLQGLGLERHEAAFRDNLIDMEVVRELTENEATRACEQLAHKTQPATTRLPPRHASEWHLGGP